MCSEITKVSNIVADKGYDSSRNRNLSKSLKINPVIPYKESVKILALLNKRLDKKIYHQRSKVETVFFVIKRKFDDTVHSKRFENQKKEAKILNIVYNFYRYTQIMVYLVGGFLQSLD